jgi:hypothetical protein
MQFYCLLQQITQYLWSLQLYAYEHDIKRITKCRILRARLNFCKSVSSLSVLITVLYLFIEVNRPNICFKAHDLPVYEYKQHTNSTEQK